MDAVDVIDIGGGFTATISNWNNYVFKDMHNFVTDIAKRKVPTLSLTKKAPPLQSR